MILVFLITAVFPLLIILSAILLDEKKFSSQKIPFSNGNKDMETGNESKKLKYIFY